MPFDLNQFRNKLVNGGARPTQFEMQITWPDALRGTVGVAGAEADFRFLCESAVLPGGNIKPFGVQYFGRTLYFAGDRENPMSGLKLSVLNDEDFKVRTALEAWQQAIQPYSTTTSQFSGGIGAGQFVTDGICTQLSRNSGGAPLVAYKFIGMWPSSIEEIQLSWKAQEGIETFNVTFSYQWWEPVDALTGASIRA